MNILHIYKDYYPVLGGIENHVRMLSEAEVKRGHSVTVLVTSLASKTYVEEMDGVRVIRAGRLATVASTPISLSLPILLRKEKPHIAHLHFPYPVGELSQLIFGKAPHFVMTYHSDVVRQKGMLRLYQPFLNRVLRAADRIIATSDNYIQSSIWLTMFRDKCAVIPLGIELSPFLSPAANEAQKIRDRYGSPLILFVGKLRYYKGLQYLLKAMQDIPATLLIIGSGPMEKEWQQLAGSLGLYNKVFFLGELGDQALPPFYHASDVFVLPASERSEAFGLVQIEAMASGLPVICTELGTGTSFVNVHGQTGLVVQPKDPSALREAIITLLNDQRLSTHMGEQGRIRAMEEFSLENMVERVLKLYHDVGSH